jgi:hypothetical protein
MGYTCPNKQAQQFRIPKARASSITNTDRESVKRHYLYTPTAHNPNKQTSSYFPRRSKKQRRGGKKKKVAFSATRAYIPRSLSFCASNLEKGIPILKRKDGRRKNHRPGPPSPQENEAKQRREQNHEQPPSSLIPLPPRGILRRGVEFSVILEVIPKPRRPPGLRHLRAEPKAVHPVLVAKCLGP